MSFKIHAASLAVAAAFPFLVSAQESGSSMEPVVVTATRIEMADVDAPYASEVHTRADIERSGTTTLYDYLSRHTSVTVMPSFGNRFTPSLDMRGYGVGDGHQNMVVSVNGRRLNNIDSVPQLIGAIPLSDIERIEITKGSGSVIYGDGAMAGTIQIHTRQRTGASLEGYVGSHAERGLSASAGFAQDRFAFSASADQAKHGGFSKKDPTGKRDESRADNWRVSLSGQPLDPVRLNFDAGKTRIDTRYPGPLSLGEFRDDPSQNTGSYTQQDYKVDYWQVGAEFDLSRELKLSLSHAREDKFSAFFMPDIAFSDEATYDYRSNDVALKYRTDALGLTLGYQTFDGSRAGSDNRTDKDNEAWFVHGQYQFDRFIVSAGWRSERVRYEYRPDTGSRLSANETLDAWDIGVNYRIDEQWSVFANYNSAFQAPDIDRFFVFGGGFNAFIAPARVRTVNVGFNHVTPSNRLKVAAFHSRLKDEIYLDPVTWANTNLDRTRKYGLEVQNAWEISTRFKAFLNYAWTRAIIDREASGGGSFNGKDLPGVSRHALNVSLNSRIGENGTLNIAHTWRSRAYAIEDFGNSFSQKQRAYHSTGVSYRHRVHRNAELFASVDNLFDRSNGLWLRDDVIYPVDFTRTWRVGAKVSF